MPLRILIVPDKFKGTLTAHAAATAITAGWRKGRPGDHLELLPMSDGGDGFGAVLGELTGARQKPAQTVDAAHRPLLAKWWQASTTETAIIDSAGIIGLAMLPKGKFHPFQLDSFGLGEVMKVAAGAGSKAACIGIGGSATNDGGFGMARALGWEFFNKKWDVLEEWWRLNELASVRPPASPLKWTVRVAVDVSNPLLGAKGCSRIYGPQKGLKTGDLALAEKCLGCLASVLESQQGITGAKTAGAGAAGGLGFGLSAFAGAVMESGFEMFARISSLDRRIRRADLVITGEGRIDEQTFMGKGVGQIAQRCASLRVPCLVLAGDIPEPERTRRMFFRARALTEIATFAMAQRAAGRHLERLACETAKAFAK